MESRDTRAQGMPKRSEPTKMGVSPLICRSEHAGLLIEHQTGHCKAKHLGEYDSSRQGKKASGRCRLLAIPSARVWPAVFGESCERLNQTIKSSSRA